MTVQSQDIKVDLVSDGISSVYNFSIKTHDPNWIIVYEDGLITVRPFTVTLNADQEVSPGGFITYTAGQPGFEVIITIARIASLDQIVDYISYNGFPADSHEKSLDKLTFISQQIADANLRSIRQDFIEDIGQMTLPSVIERAGKTLIFDSNGNVDVSSIPLVNNQVSFKERMIPEVILENSFWGGSIDFNFDASTVIMTAPGFDGDFDYQQGVAYSYSLLSGNYIYPTKVPDPAVGIIPSDHFALFAQINDAGDLIMVNAPRYVNGATNGGRIWAYGLSGGSWVERPAVIIGAGHPTDAFNGFGFTHSLNSIGDRMIVGEPFFDNGPSPSAGKISILETTDNWVTFTYTGIFGTVTNDKFGYNVFMSGDGYRVFIGAYQPYGGVPAGTYTGRVLIHERFGGTWGGLARTLTPSPYQADSMFGVALSQEGTTAEDAYCGNAITSSYDGNRVAIGARNFLEPISGIRSGAVYIFEFNGSNFVQKELLIPTDITKPAWYGFSVSMSADGTKLVVGSQNEDYDIYTDTGVLYFYELRSGYYELVAKLPAQAPQSYSYSGYAAAISPNGQIAANGAVNEDLSILLNPGAVYIYNFLNS